MPAPPFALEELELRRNYGNAPHNELNSWLMFMDCAPFRQKQVNWARLVLCVALEGAGGM